LPFRRRLPVFLAAVIAFSVLAAIGVARISRPAAVLETANGARAIRYGEPVRSDDQAGTVMVLADGSRVEMRAHTDLSLERVENGVAIELKNGDVLVNAAKQRRQHLYVRTRDVTVSVVGTVFLVSAEEKGSRVAVIEGEVRVRQGKTEHRLRRGEEVTTNPSLPSLVASAKENLELLQQQAVTEDQNKFEVFAVRPESGNGGFRGSPVRCHGIDGVFPLPPRAMTAGGVIGEVSAVPRGRCVGRYVTLITLISTAYGVPERNVFGGPDWMRSSFETFQIEGKAEAYATVTRDQLRQMLQQLLMDRFKLEVRRETKEAPGYALVLSQNGSQLQPASGDPELYLEQNGQRNQFNMLRGGQITIKGQATLQFFADYLSVAPLLGLNHVVEKTSLPGMYQFSLTLNMLPPELPGRGGVRGEGTALSSPRIEWDPSIAKAMEVQLGLSLAPEKVPETVLVIEHAEKPSEN